MPRDRRPRPGSRPPGVPSGDLVVRTVRAMSALLPGVFLSYRAVAGGVDVTLDAGAIAALEALRPVRGEQTATEAIADVTDGSPVGWRRERHDDKEQG